MRRLIRGLAPVFRGLRALWLILGVTLLLVAVLEGSLRIGRQIKRGRDMDELASRVAFRGAPWARDLLEEQERNVRMEWSPYVHFRAAPYAGRYFHIDEHGLRRTAQARPAAASAGAAKTSRQHLIWVFGGSVVWGWDVREDHTIPSELARELAAAGYRVEVVNRGQIGYVSTQEVLALITALRAGGRPDVVVFLGGYNDLVATMQEGAAGLPQNEHKRRQEFNVGLYRGAIAAADNSAMMWFVKALLRRTGMAADARQSYGGPGQPSLESLSADLATNYAENVRLVEQIRPGYGFRALYYWQPVGYWKKVLVGDEQHLRDVWPAMKELLARARTRLATTPPLNENVPFRDLTGLFDDSTDPVFIDLCHLAEACNATVAREIANDVKPLLDQRSRDSASR